MKKCMKKLSILLVLILLLQTGCSKNKKIDWEQIIRNDFFSSESIVEQTMADEVSFKITQKEKQLVVNVNAPNICDELLGWMESVSDTEFNEMIMEQEILRLLKESQKIETEFLLNCSVNDEEVEIEYTTEFGEAITCGMTRFYAEVTQQILEEIGEDAL